MMTTIKCSLRECRATSEHPFWQGVYRMVKQSPGWLAFFDISNGLAVRFLCPEHAPPLRQAVLLLEGVFGEDLDCAHLSLALQCIKQESKLDPGIDSDEDPESRQIEPAGSG